VDFAAQSKRAWSGSLKGSAGKCSISPRLGLEQVFAADVSE